MNISFDWGAVIVAGLGAIGSLGVMKSDMRWIRDGMKEIKDDVAKAHKRIDMVLSRDHKGRGAD